jgi:hypothetical protein
VLQNYKNKTFLFIYTGCTQILFNAQLSPILYVEEDAEITYMKRVSFTAASSTEEALSLDYDTDYEELHYKFTAFGR